MNDDLATTGARRAAARRRRRGALAAATTALLAATAMPQSGDERALAAFERLSAAKQQAVLAKATAAVAAIDDPWLRSVAVLAEQGRKLRKSKLAKAHWRDRHPEGASYRGAGRELPYPRRAVYVWGWREIVAVDGVGVIGRGRAVAGRKTRDAAERRGAMAALLAGVPPDADLAVAAALSRLDTDRAPDALARFLEAWRNGTESFYEALDRTAGTPDSVFFFDVMLGAFVDQIVPRKQPELRQLRSNLQAAHDALHAAFLAYRQYRALREAIALSAVLPPDTALPSHLQRYDATPPSGYGTRQLLAMLLKSCGGDVGALVELTNRTATALPDPLWKGGYEPLGALQRAFADRMPTMIDAASNTDAYLTRALQHRREITGKIAAAAHAALEHAGAQ